MCADFALQQLNIHSDNILTFNNLNTQQNNNFILQQPKETGTYLEVGIWGRGLSERGIYVIYEYT